MLCQLEEDMARCGSMRLLQRTVHECQINPVVRLFIKRREYKGRTGIRGEAANSVTQPDETELEIVPFCLEHTPQCHSFFKFMYYLLGTAEDGLEEI